VIKSVERRILPELFALSSVFCEFSLLVVDMHYYSKNN
jgi:hypothetical protein